MYDLHFVLPIAPSTDKYRVRMETMKKYGLLNLKGRSVLLSLLVEESFRDVDTLTRGWDSRLTVNVHRIPYTNVVHKHSFFARNLMRPRIANWTVRVDDDSVTDIGALHRRLDEFDPMFPYHIIAQECGDGSSQNLWAGYISLFRRFGFSNEDMHRWNHSWEISVDSDAAIDRLCANDDVRRMHETILEFEESKALWSDQVHCYTMRMCGVMPYVSNFLSRKPDIDSFSLFGGHLAHVHYVAPDMDKKNNVVPRDGLWTEFSERLDRVRR